MDLNSPRLLRMSSLYAKALPMASVALPREIGATACHLHLSIARQEHPNLAAEPSIVQGYRCYKKYSHPTALRNADVDPLSHRSSRPNPVHRLFPRAAPPRQ